MRVALPGLFGLALVACNCAGVPSPAVQLTVETGSSEGVYQVRAWRRGKLFYDEEVRIRAGQETMQHWIGDSAGGYQIRVDGPDTQWEAQVVVKDPNRECSFVETQYLTVKL